MSPQEYQRIKTENLSIARELANYPHVRPDSDFFMFSVPHENESLRLRYTWEEVWPAKKLADHRLKHKMSMDSAKKLNEEKCKDIGEGEFVEI